MTYESFSAVAGLFSNPGSLPPGLPDVDLIVATLSIALAFLIYLPRLS